MPAPPEKTSIARSPCRTPSKTDSPWSTAAHKYNRVVAVGSQRVSSVLYAKAKEIYDSGKLGEVFSINAYWDRNSPSGAWVYPIPPDASEQTIDWKAFLVGAPQVPFDAKRFFRWRCYTDYGEGLGGDLFVHLLSGIQFITGINEPAQRAMSSGGIFHFKDGREFPDLIETLYDYPNCRVTLRCNLNNNGGEFIGFYGTKGTMIIKDATLTYKPEDTRPEPEGYSIFGWPKALRDQYLQKWHEDHPEPEALKWKVDETGESYANPPGYSDTVDHQANFYNAVRTRKPVVENEVFGNNAAIGCHLANFSYFNKTVAVWDPVCEEDSQRLRRNTRVPHPSRVFRERVGILIFSGQGDSDFSRNRCTHNSGPPFSRSASSASSGIAAE